MFYVEQQGGSAASPRGPRHGRATGGAGWPGLLVVEWLSRAHGGGTPYTPSAPRRAAGPLRSRNQLSLTPPPPPPPPGGCAICAAPMCTAPAIPRRACTPPPCASTVQRLRHIPVRGRWVAALPAPSPRGSCDAHPCAVAACTAPATGHLCHTPLRHLMRAPVLCYDGCSTVTLEGSHHA